jgi:hypothetical protein
VRGAAGLVPSAAAEGEGEPPGCWGAFGAAGVSGRVLLPVSAAPAPRADAAVEADLSAEPALDAALRPRALGAGPAAARTTDEHTVQVETASRAADMVLQPASRLLGLLWAHFSSAILRAHRVGGELYRFRRFVLERSLVVVLSPCIVRDEQRGQKRRCTLSDIAAHSVRRDRLSQRCTWRCSLRNATHGLHCAQRVAAAV